MKLYVEKVGVGPKIVLLHGWGFNGAIWHQLVDKLQDRYEMTMIDLPGLGRSAKYESDYQPSSLAKDVANVIDGECVLMGWSMGGIIAQQIALDYPEKVKKLVLLSCNAQFVADSIWPWGINAEVLNTFSNNLRDDYKATLHRFLMLQARGGENTRETIREMKQRLFEHGEPDQQALLNGLQLLQNTSFIDSLNRLKLPTLIMQGRRDTLVPASSGSEMLKLLPDGQLCQFEYAAHAPFVSHLNEFADVLEQFASQ